MISVATLLVRTSLVTPLSDAILEFALILSDSRKEQILDGRVLRGIKFKMLRPKRFERGF